MKLPTFKKFQIPKTKFQTFLQDSRLRIHDSGYKLLNLLPFYTLYFFSLAFYNLQLATSKEAQKGFIRLTKKTLTTYLIIFIALSGTGIFYLFNPFSAKKTEAAWFNDDWAYRKPITFTHNAPVSSPSQVELDVDTTAAPDQFQADCGDVRFTDVSGNLLRYYYDSAAGACDNASTDFDVLMPTVINGANIIYMYYGNPSSVNGTEAADFSDATTTPSGGAPSAGSEEKASAPVAYWKLDDAQGTAAQDSTVENNDGTITGAAWKTEDQCIAGKCLYFDGDDDVTTTDKNYFSPPNNDVTVTLWAKIPSAASASGSGARGSTGRYIISKASASNYEWALENDNNNMLNVIVWNSDGSLDNYIEIPGQTLNDNLWHFYAIVIDYQTTLSLYRDGVLLGSTAINRTVTNGTQAVQMGRRGDGNHFIGFIDEVKIYPQARTAAQLKSDFSARSNPEAAATFGANTQNMPGALSNGLVGHWKMDESSGNRSDSSGNGITLTDNNTVASTVGKFGSSGYFLAANSEYLSSTDNASLSTGDIDFTLSGWVFLDSGSGGANRTIIDKEQQNINAAEYRLRYVSSGTAFAFDIWDSGANNVGSVTATSTAVSTGRWYFVVAWHDSAANTVNIQVDNGTVHSSTTTGAPADTAARFGIGAEMWTINTFWNGSIDEARMYKRVLSGAERAQLYNWAPGPVGYWKLEEGAGNTAYDSSGNGNDLTWTNTPTSTNGKYGSAINLAGSDQQLTRTDDGDFDFADDTDMSFEAWFKHNTASAQEIIMSKYNEAGYKMIMESDGDITCALDYDSTWTPTDSATSTAATYDDNQWHHAACVKSGAASLRLYIDGVLITTDSSITSTNTLTNSDPLYIGIDADGSSNDFVGQIDEPKIYNYARTSGQVIEDMNAGHPAPGSPVGTPLGHWGFDEGYGTTTANVGNAGSALNGTLTNSPSWTQNGKVGKALDFEDTSTQYVQIPDRDALSFGNSTTDSPFSLSAWFKAESINTLTFAQAADFIISKDDITQVREWGLAIGNTNDLAFTLHDDSTSGSIGVNYDGISTGTWYHVVATYDGSGSVNGIKIYLNGRQVTTSNTSSGSYTAMENGAEDVRIGDWNDATPMPFDGVIDEVKIYNSALTADQVKVDMNQAKSQVLGALGDNSNYDKNAANQEYCVPGDATSCAAPVARWDFEEKTGTTANDSSGNANTGTLTSGPSYTRGQGGSALSFNGSSNWVTVPDSASLRPTQVTVEAWVNLNSLADSQTIIAKDKGTGQSYGLAIGNVNAGYLEFASYNGSWFVAKVLSSTLSPKRWYHVTGTYDGTNLRLYVDGVLKDTVALTSIDYTAGPSDRRLAFGRYYASGAGAAYLNGKIDNVRIFNYARSASQIAWDYNKGGPVGYWRLDDCQGTSITNATGNGNTGTLVIGAGGTEDTVGTCDTSSTAWGNGVSGKRNYSIGLDATDDYVEVLTPTNLPTGDFTYSIWANVVGTGTTRSYIWVSNGASGTAFGINDNNMASINVVINGSTRLNQVLVPASNTWYHIAATREGSTVKLYFNGKLQSTTGTYGTAISYGSGCSLIFGALSNTGACTGADRFFTRGKLDDVKIFNYALTATQIQTEYNQGAVNFGPSTGAP